MKRKYILSIVLLLALLAGTAAQLVMAEEGIMFRRNVSKTPELETEKAAVFMMDFYVPAQAADGTVGPVDNYYLDDGDQGTCDLQTGEGCTSAIEPRNYAKPLFSAYIDGKEGLPHEEESLIAQIAGILGIEQADEIETIEAVEGGIVFGEFDAYIGVSLDDGTTWRTENLSRSADLSSFTLSNGLPFPGGVHSVVHQVAEDKILAVWASKYCESGYPLYSADLENTDELAYLADLETNWGKNAMYLYDFFGVAGNQGSVDYTEQGWPEVGEVPYSCIWTARGKLLPGDDPMTADMLEASHVVWTKPERLTSGVRDANLPAVDCAGGAGCALTWQEDPEGLRPGKGLGPGEGWSGAIANAKTDIWYSYITFADFDFVVNDTDGDDMADPGEAMLIEEYEALKLAEMDRPKPYVPMAIPVRLTDNDMCRATASTQGDNPEDPFCWIDFDAIDTVNSTNITTFLDGLTAPQTGADFCASTVDWTNPGGTTLSLCVTEDGRWMIGRVGSTRVRMILKPYTPSEAVDMDGDGFVEKSAWLSLASEETKALGVTSDLDGDGETSDETVDPIDIGKDMFYYSFDFAKPYNLNVNASLDAVDPSPYVVQQGGMLNQPAKCSPYFITTDQTHPDIECIENEFFPTQIDPFTGYEYYLTEIARRFALTLNNPGNITDPASGGAGLSGMLIYKQGIIWQGGPADIMLRRTVVEDFCTDTDSDGEVDNTDECFDKTSENPYAYERMECEYDDGSTAWVYTDGTNPNYLKGLCLAPAINISGTTIKTCTVGTGNDACAAAFPMADDGTIPDELKDEQFPKVTEWRNCDGMAAIEGCETDNDLDDQSWENPYDVAKGHRGFLYGDFVMMMYAWSPNWQSNAVGNDHYNLYQRRSFDGGVTWTTTPAELGGAGISVRDYYYGETIGEYVPYLWTYAAGEFEQARNLSLLHGNKVTILDPRYSPPGGLKQYSTIRTDWLAAHADVLPSFEDVLPYPDDAAIDPSKYFMVYETGDNTTVAVGEAIPLDLFYSRATVYGDIYEWFDYVNDEDDCNPQDTDGDGVIDVDMETCIEPRWPWLENAQDDLSGEASVVFNPGGTFAYNVWNQWREEITEDGHEHIFDSDMVFRRLMWLPDDYIPLEGNLAPVTYLLYSSHTGMITLDDTLTLVGFARDLDAEDGDGIAEVVWTLSMNGGTSVKLSNQQMLNVKVRDNMQPGWAQISFKAKDKEGRWSPGTNFVIKVVEFIPASSIYLPVVVNP